MFSYILTLSFITS